MLGWMSTRTPGLGLMSSQITTLRSSPWAPWALGHATVISSCARGHPQPHPWSSSLQRDPVGPGSPAL